MKTTLLIKSLVLACIAGILVAGAQAEEGQTDAAITAAKEWVALVDAGEYKASWEQAAPFFKEQVKEDQWVAMVGAVRNPLGQADSRELLGAQFTTTLPGAPEGEYVVIQFKTAFAGKPDSIETITPMKADGEWRVSGYFIK